VRDERGQSLSVFVTVVVVALLLVAGLVVDGGAQADASRRAEGAAALAARAAADTTATARLAGREADRLTAVAAARQVLDAHPGIAGDVVVQGDRVQVTTRATTPTVLLNLIGIRELAATGSATAALSD
jgi:transcription elongation GreA/GreB family factor